jgi:plastocyanin
MKTVVIVVVAILVIAGGALALTKKSDNKSTTSQPSSSQQSNNNSSNNTNSSSSDQTAAATITYGDNGFSPSTVTVKSGDTILIKNTSSNPLQFDSDPHPAHTDDPELNVGDIAPGSSGTLKATTVGTHGYHNHLNPSDTGTIVVQ